MGCTHLPRVCQLRPSCSLCAIVCDLHDLSPSRRLPNERGPSGGGEDPLIPRFGIFGRSASAQGAGGDDADDDDDEDDDDDDDARHCCSGLKYKGQKTKAGYRMNLYLVCANV
eukprot:5368568-Amphidinium_carterae.1